MNLPYSSLRDYSESELLALPPDSRLLFAENIHQGIITYNSTTSKHVLHPPHTFSEPELHQLLSPVSALRCISHPSSVFSLHPTTNQQHRINHFLWRAANQVCFDAREASQLFQRNVFVICMPAALFDFLTAVTWEQFESALVCVLATLARRDHRLELLKNDLAPELAHYVDDYIQNPDPLIHCCPDVFCLLVESIMDGISCIRPWVVPISLAYLSATDITELFNGRCDRPIFSTPEKFELMHSMMWNIYRDWQTYREVLVKNGSRSRLNALELMAKTISQGTQKLVDQGIRTLKKLVEEKRINSLNSIHDAIDIHTQTGSTSTTRCNRRKPRSNYISKLPAEIVYSEIIPRICDTYVQNQQFLPRRLGSVQNVDTGIEPWPSPHLHLSTSLKTLILEDHTLHQLYHSYDSEEEDVFEEIHLDIDEDEPEFDYESESEEECEYAQDDTDVSDGFEEEEHSHFSEIVHVVNVTEDFSLDSTPTVVTNDVSLSPILVEEQSMITNVLLNMHQSRSSVVGLAGGSI